MADQALRISMLEQENVRLRDRVAILEQALVGCDVSFVRLGLPRREERILAVLLTRTRVSKEQLHAAVYADEHEVDTPEPAVIESHVCKLRRKLRALGVAVSSGRYNGYWMEPDQKDALRRLLGQEASAPALRSRKAA